MYSGRPLRLHKCSPAFSWSFFKAALINEANTSICSRSAGPWVKPIYREHLFIITHQCPNLPRSSSYLSCLLTFPITHLVGVRAIPLNRWTPTSFRAFPNMAQQHPLNVISSDVKDNQNTASCSYWEIFQTQIPIFYPCSEQKAHCSFDLPFIRFLRLCGTTVTQVLEEGQPCVDCCPLVSISLARKQCILLIRCFCFQNLKNIAQK